MVPWHVHQFLSNSKQANYLRMKAKKTNRREFLKKTACAATGAIVFPTLLSSCSKGANSRIQIAHIGTGGRGTSTALTYFLPRRESLSLATCDAFTDRREDLAKRINGFYKKQDNQDINCRPYLDFQEILERKDIDAVHISSGDYWHLPMAIRAARAGKHIYLEKPLGLSLNYMIELEKLVKQKNLVFHYGTQQRSLEHVRKGIEMVKSGQIGEIEKIEIWAPPGEDKPLSSQIQEPPATLDYDRWLGPAPVKPYSPARVAYSGAYFIYDYSLGFISGWGAHPLDVAVWGAKDQMNDRGTFSAKGAFYPEDIIFDTVKFWDMNIDYENGLNVRFVSNNYANEMTKKLKSGDGTTFYGSKGWISLARGAAASSIPALHSKLNENVNPENNLHGLNFIKTIKDEMEPLTPISEAIISDCISHMGNILIRSGKDKIVWDAPGRKIINYPELEKKYFHRNLRAPYTL